MRTTRRTSSCTSSTTPRARQRERRSRSSLSCRRSVSRFASNRHVGLVLFAASVLAACEIGTVDIPKTTPTVVVHAVLNPSAPNQVVLLERTLTGTVTIPDTTFDAADPI